MKRLIVAVAATLALAGCSASGSPADSPKPSARVTSAAPSSIATTAITASPPAAPEFVVTIDGSHKTKDFDGKPALVVDYTFKNHSEEGATFIVAILAKAFQNGVQLESAFVVDDRKYNPGQGMKEIKPGASIKVQAAYVLAGKSDVSIEVSESLSFDDSLIASKTIKVK